MILNFKPQEGPSRPGQHGGVWSGVRSGRGSNSLGHPHSLNSPEKSSRSLDRSRLAVLALERPQMGQSDAKNGKLRPIGELLGALGLKMSQSGCGLFLAGGLSGTATPGPSQLPVAAAGRGHQGAQGPVCPAGEQKGPLCGDLGGAAALGDAHKPFSVP